ncbi:hypothetical protein OG21DRAFT_449768 [Imleria badia]|nr:hypothetical protein OG21DRAFT_449768 [Imleria badia]
MFTFPNVSSLQIALSLEEGLGVISDLFTTCTLCYILTSSRGGLRRTTPPMRRLFFFFLNRGILVTVIQIGTLVAFVAKPASMYWAPFHFSKSKLYTNTLPPRTPSPDRSLPFQNVSNGETETANQVYSEIPDRDQIEAWDALPVLVVLEKHSSSSC